jgi:hypothetical protein
VPLTALDAAIDSDTPSGEARLRAILNSGEGGPRFVRWNGERRRELLPGPTPASREDVAHRIREMRDHGMTLQAIADRLNEERVPTPKGGREWRRSSVHSLLGYRQPRTRR